MSETTQLGLFDGDTFDPEKDGERLLKQLVAVREFMADERWHSLAEISAGVDAPEASVSARLRDLRKLKFGAWRVNRRSRGDRRSGLYEYQMLPPIDPEEEKEKKKGDRKDWRKPPTRVMLRGVMEIAAHLKFCEHKERPVTDDAKRVLDYWYSEIGI